MTKAKENIQAEVEDLLRRLSDSEKHDLLESLRERWRNEREEVKSIYRED